MPGTIEVNNPVFSLCSAVDNQAEAKGFVGRQANKLRVVASGAAGLTVAFSIFDLQGRKETTDQKKIIHL